MFTRIKTEQEIIDMRESGRILATIHQLLKESLAPGMSTKELADIARKELKSLGGTPSFLNYGPSSNPFPDVVCISVNDEVVHGVPRADHIVAEGDLVSFDLGVTVNGMITDAAITVPCGKATDQHLEFLAHTRKSLEAGLKAVKHGCKVGDIAFAVQKSLERHDYGIVRDLVGHGVGHYVHEDPNIPNYGRKGSGPQLVAGMTVAIEPMATLGNYGIYTADDGWTIKTNDGSMAAHFEHTVLITQTGCEILTAL